MIIKCLSWILKFSHEKPQSLWMQTRCTIVLNVTEYNLIKKPQGIGHINDTYGIFTWQNIKCNCIGFFVIILNFDHNFGQKAVCSGWWSCACIRKK